MPGSIKTLTLLNRIMRGSLTGATLNDTLADPATLGAFKTGLTQRAFCAALINDASVAAIVFGSARASSACFESAVMRKAIWESDTALLAIAASATAKTAARAASGVQTISLSMTDVPVVASNITVPSILIGWSVSAYGAVLSGRRSGSRAGALSAGLETITGVTAGYDNIVPLTTMVTVASSNQATATMYLCFLVV